MDEDWRLCENEVWDPGYQTAQFQSGWTHNMDGRFDTPVSFLGFPVVMTSL